MVEINILGVLHLTAGLLPAIRGSAVEVLELAPPYVQTELGGPSQATDLNAMPLAEYVAEVMHLLAGKGVFGPPKDPAAAVLREAVALGVNHLDTSDFYGPHVTNRLIREALHPYRGGSSLARRKTLVLLSPGRLHLVDAAALPGRHHPPPGVTTSGHSPFRGTGLPPRPRNRRPNPVDDLSGPSRARRAFCASSDAARSRYAALIMP